MCARASGIHTPPALATRVLRLAASISVNSCLQTFGLMQGHEPCNSNGQEEPLFTEHTNTIVSHYVKNCKPFRCLSKTIIIYCNCSGHGAPILPSLKKNCLPRSSIKARLFAYLPGAILQSPGDRPLGSERLRLVLQELLLGSSMLYHETLGQDMLPSTSVIHHCSRRVT